MSRRYPAFGVVEVLVAVACMGIALVAVMGTLRAVREQSLITTDRTRTTGLARDGAAYIRIWSGLSGSAGLQGTAAYIPEDNMICANGWSGCATPLNRIAPGGSQSYGAQLTSIASVRVAEQRVTNGGGTFSSLVSAGSAQQAGLPTIYFRRAITISGFSGSFTNSQGTLDPVLVQSLQAQLRTASVSVVKESGAGLDERTRAVIPVLLPTP